MEATVGVLQWHIHTPQQQATVVTGVQSVAGVQTEHDNTRFWQCLGQCTSRTGDRMVLLRFVGSGGAYMQKPVYTHPFAPDAAYTPGRDSGRHVFILDFCLSAKRKS